MLWVRVGNLIFFKEAIGLLEGVAGG